MEWNPDIRFQIGFQGSLPNGFAMCKDIARFFGSTRKVQYIVVPKDIKPSYRPKF